MPRLASIAPALVTALSVAGCTLFYTATRRNNGARSCIDTPAPGIVDILLGSAGAIATLTDDSGQPRTLPLIASGLVFTMGVVSVAAARRCQGRDRGSAPTYVPFTAPPPPPRDPDADPIDFSPPDPSLPTVDLRLPADLALPPQADAGVPTTPPNEERDGGSR